MAEIIENRADLVLTALKVTSERNAAIDFGVALMETGIAIIVSLRPGAVSATAFLSKFLLYHIRQRITMIISRTL